MANTINRNGNVIMISGIDSDWIWSDSFPVPNGIPVALIRFDPGAANDLLVVKDGSDAGPELAHLLALDVEPRVEYLFGAVVRPVLDFSACTLSAGASVTLVLKD